MCCTTSARNRCCATGAAQQVLHNRCPCSGGGTHLSGIAFRGLGHRGRHKGLLRRARIRVYVHTRRLGASSSGAGCAAAAPPGWPLIMVRTYTHGINAYDTAWRRVYHIPRNITCAHRRSWCPEALANMKNLLDYSTLSTQSFRNKTDTCGARQKRLFLRNAQLTTCKKVSGQAAGLLQQEGLLASAGPASTVTVELTVALSTETVAPPPTCDRDAPAGGQPP